MSGETHQRHGFGPRPGPVSRYDLVLWLIPAAFVLALALSTLSAISTHTAIVGASLLGLFAIVDAVALHPPRAG
ncbi:hypothetical protein [Halalkalicoccus tibetensis]|uniref:Uncharacterized protein n=1 Tax=Halalkalicoccus tibetensis TaxID=175632 RepID=A0ABD5V3F6_9EURY